MADWPLYEKAAQSWDGPVTMSTGGAGEDIIDRSVSFTNRNFDLTLMHCVALYPTETTSSVWVRLNTFGEDIPASRLATPHTSHRRHDIGTDGLCAGR